MTYAHPNYHQFECEVCHKVLSSRQNYRQHQHIHTGDRPYVCDICGGGYRQGSQLTIHRRKHFAQARLLPIFKLTDHLSSLRETESLNGQRKVIEEDCSELVLPKVVPREDQSSEELPIFTSQF